MVTTIPSPTEASAVRAEHRTQPTPAYWQAVVGGVGIVAFVVTGAQIVLDSTRQLFGMVADDAFYYFDIARRFPHMGTAPGVTTSGFHPLYWALLVPIFHVMTGTAGVRAALLVVLAGHMAAGWLLFLLLRRRWAPSVAGVVAVFWMTSAVLQGIVLMGVETGVAELAILGLLLACDPDAEATPQRCLGVGVLLGLTYLARNDAVIVSGPVAFAWLWSRRADLRSRRSGLLMPGSATVVAAPWVGYLLAHGSVLTDSARALPTLAGRQGGIGVIIRWTLDTMFSLVVALGANRINVGSVVGVTMGAGVLIAAGFLWRRSHWGRGDLPLLFSVPVLFVLYVIALRGIRVWYFVYLAIWLFVLVLPPIADRVGELLKPVADQWRAVPIVGAIVTLALLLANAPAKTAGEVNKYEAAVAARRILPSGARLASFNSGVYQFVLTGHVVENLDGVVNPAVVPFVEHHQLCTFLTRTHTTWFLDSSLDQLNSEPHIRIASSQVLIGGISGDTVQILARLDTTGCQSQVPITVSHLSS